jgi:hypothetical protein
MRDRLHALIFVAILAISGAAYAQDPSSGTADDGGWGMKRTTLIIAAALSAGAIYLIRKQRPLELQ